MIYQIYHISFQFLLVERFCHVPTVFHGFKKTVQRHSNDLIPEFRRQTPGVPLSPVTFTEMFWAKPKSGVESK